MAAPARLPPGGRHHGLLKITNGRRRWSPWATMRWLERTKMNCALLIYVIFLKTIADFRKDIGEAVGRVCRQFVVLCRRLEPFSEAERCDRW
jgi:hypothetical protein